MARATTCLLNGRELDVDEALRLRDQARQSGNSDPAFRCVECGESVRPHTGSDYGVAHIEHENRNPDCHLSDASR
jgi:5-methylcytosine-specific restriction enzyme A